MGYRRWKVDFILKGEYKMAIQFCDICGGTLSANEGAGFAICELCGAKKILNTKPAETNHVLENYVIPEKFSNVPLEKEKADLEKKINSILQENIDIDGLIEKTHNDVNYWQEEISNAQQEMNILIADIKRSDAVWANDRYDPRYLHVQQKQFKRTMAIRNKFDNAQKEMTQQKNKIPPLKNKMSENKRKIINLQANLKSIEDELRKTPAQRAEAHYQRLIEEKNANPSIEKLIELVKQFREMEDYRNAKKLADECFDLGMKKKYDDLVQQKNNMDSSEIATEEDYKTLAKIFREAKGYANTEELANECDNSAVKTRYKQLVQAKNRASTEKEYQDIAKQFREMNNYEDTSELASECDNQYRILKEQRKERERQEQERIRQEEELKRQREEQERHERYNRLVQFMNQSPTEKDYQKLTQDFRAMNGYKDTSELAGKCDTEYEKLKELREEQERKDAEEAQRKKRKKRIIGIILRMVMGIIAIGLVFVFFSKSDHDSESDNNHNNSVSNENFTPESSPISITNSDMFYIPVKDNNDFYKYISLKGENITESKYISAYMFQYERALVQHKDRSWGYIDTRGKNIACCYTQGLSYRESIAWVNKNGTIVAINANGDEIMSLPDNIISVWPFYDNWALFASKGEQSYIDKNNNTIGGGIFFADAKRFQENAASVKCDNGKYGYINTDGNFIIECKFDVAKVFQGQMAIVQINDEQGVINKQGKILFKGNFEYLIPDENTFRYKRKNENWGWLNSSGKIIIQPKYEETANFGTRNIAPVKSNGLWGYIDRKENFVIAPQFKYAYNFFNNRALVQFTNDEWGTINENGTIDLKTEYKTLSPSYWNLVFLRTLDEPRIMAVNPSFNCNKTNIDAEIMICKSVELVGYDKKITELYNRLKDSYSEKDVKTFQKNFIRKRNACSTVECLTELYLEQINSYE